MSIVSEIVDVCGYEITEAYLTPDQWVRPQTRIYPTDFALHWSGNINFAADDMANRNYFENLVGGYASSQTFCDMDSILALIPFTPDCAEMAYHLGASKYYGKFAGTYPNANFLGHEMAVNKDGNFRETYKRSVWLMTYWCFIYNADPQLNIWRHRDVTGKQCPYMMIDDVLDYNKTYSMVYSMYTHITDNNKKTQLINEGIKFIMEELHIDGIRGEELWTKFKNDVEELLDIMKRNNGVLTIEESEILKLETWQWDMLTTMLHELYMESVNGKLKHPLLSDYNWVNKSINRTLTQSELAWLNTVLVARSNGIEV